MNIGKATEMIWDYMHMHHELKKSDAILVLGNRDLRVAEYAAKLYLDGWAPILICSGSGSIHDGKPGRENFVNTTEAEVFAEIAIKNGVPKEAIIIENESQNTGDNYKFTANKLKQLNIYPKSIILVQKPYMERRAYATGKIWMPDTELIMTSPPIPFNAYPYESVTSDYLMNSIVGDLQRIIEYPKQGFQIEQDVPPSVLEAYEFLIKEGYTKKMI